MLLHSIQKNVIMILIDTALVFVITISIEGGNDMAERIFTREDAKSLIRTNTRSLKIPSDYTAIASGALAGFSQLEDLVIPEGITKISSYAFYVRSFKNTSNLKSLTLPSSLYPISPSTFSGCIALTDVALPEELEEIGERAFFCCTALKEIVIPDPVEIIGDFAFSNCIALESIELPEDLETIGPNTFDQAQLSFLPDLSDMIEE